MLTWASESRAPRSRSRRQVGWSRACCSARLDCQTLGVALRKTLPPENGSSQGGV